MRVIEAGVEAVAGGGVIVLAVLAGVGVTAAVVAAGEH